jgi:hypothetical protein
MHLVNWLSSTKRFVKSFNSFCQFIILWTPKVIKYFISSKNCIIQKVGVNYMNWNLWNWDDWFLIANWQSQMQFIKLHNFYKWKSLFKIWWWKLYKCKFKYNWCDYIWNNSSMCTFTSRHFKWNLWRIVLVVGWSSCITISWFIDIFLTNGDVHDLTIRNFILWLICSIVISCTSFSMSFYESSWVLELCIGTNSILEFSSSYGY